MAKASKYNRARIRSRVRRPKRRGGSTMWTVITVVIVAVGAALVAWSVSENKSASAQPPEVGDHWHAYLGVNVCGSWLPDAPEFHPRANETNIQAGLHSHGDGLVHLHPFSSDESGSQASLGRFVDYGGWELSGTSFTLWDGQTHENGQECGEGADAKPAKVQWAVGHYGKEWTGKPRTGNPADYRPKNGDIIGIYLLPEGEELPEPPNAERSLTSISDLGGAPVKDGPPPGGAGTGGTGGTGTGGAGTTDTTAPAGTTPTEPSASTTPSSTP